MLLSKKIIFSLFMLVFSLLSLDPETAVCGNVSGKIRISGTKNIHVSIDIPTPAPKTIILTMRLPEGVKVASARPAPARLLPERREVNWLLSGLGPGEKKIKCSLNKKVRLHDITVSVRYKDPGTGKIEDHILNK